MDAILFWNEVALEVTRRDFTKEFIGNPLQGGPTRTSRALAIVHLAMHDAHFGIVGGAQTYLQRRGIVIPPSMPGADPGAAVAGAATQALMALYPAFATFINEQAGKSCVVGSNQNILNGWHFGATIGRSLLQARKIDGASYAAPYAYANDYGAHRPDPFDPSQSSLSPGWGAVDHFVAAGHVPLNPPPGYGLPDYLADPTYLQDYEEVRRLGACDSATRSADQTAIGLYWAYDGAQKIGVPPRLYNQIAREVAANRKNTPSANAKLFAAINAGMADAGIDAWHWKYVYNLWRPVIGIREAAKTMGPSAVGGPSSSATPGGFIGDPFWSPLGRPGTNIPGEFSRTPNFPAYPSGHATFGAALFQILQLSGGNAPITAADVIAAEDAPPGGASSRTFEFVSDELNGESVDPEGYARSCHLRKYDNFITPILENALSRVYLGVHWRFDGLARKGQEDKPIGGVPLGLEIGKQAWDFFK